MYIEHAMIQEKGSLFGLDCCLTTNPQSTVHDNYLAGQTKQ